MLVMVMAVVVMVPVTMAMAVMLAVVAVVMAPMAVVAPMMMVARFGGDPMMAMPSATMIVEHCADDVERPDIAFASVPDNGIC